MDYEYLKLPKYTTFMLLILVQVLALNIVVYSFLNLILFVVGVFAYVLQ